jgi:acetyltransferase
VSLGTITKVMKTPTKGTPRQKTLDPFFVPKNMAVIGATEKVGSVGRTVVLNLSQGAFSDKVYAVNPKHKEVCGVRVFPSIGEVPA